jgi:hypothetical protein
VELSGEKHFHRERTPQRATCVQESLLLLGVYISQFAVGFKCAAILFRFHKFNCTRGKHKKYSSIRGGIVCSYVESDIMCVVSIMCEITQARGNKPVVQIAPAIWLMAHLHIMWIGMGFEVKLFVI